MWEEIEDVRNNVAQTNNGRKSTVLELVRCGRRFQTLQSLNVAEAAHFWSCQGGGGFLMYLSAASLSAQFCRVA